MIADEFLAFAGNIAVRAGQSAASYRSATSRAYYGAFHLASQLLRALAHDPGHNHGNVQFYLQACTKAEPKAAGGLLGELQSLRIRADYRLEQLPPDGQDAAQDALALATKIQSLLAKCADEASRRAMADDIAAYLEKLAEGRR